MTLKIGNCCPIKTNPSAVLPHEPLTDSEDNILELSTYKNPEVLDGLLVICFCKHCGSLYLQCKVKEKKK
jgi:hypothetical protein